VPGSQHFGMIWQRTADNIAKIITKNIMNAIIKMQACKRLNMPNTIIQMQAHQKAALKSISMMNNYLSLPS